MNKWKSRKFWVAVGVVITTLAAGIGLDIKPEIIALLTAGESMLWVLIEGILDAVSAPSPQESIKRLQSRKLWVTLIAILQQIVLGFGYKMNPEFVTAIIGAEGFIWMIIQAVIDLRIRRNVGMS